MKQAKNYELLYQKNEKNGNVIIGVALDDYLEFFHQWDNSIFRKRDIHPELARFFDLCSEDIPLRKSIEIQICVKSPEINIEKEDQIRKSYYNFYSSLNRTESRKAKRFMRLAGILLLSALLLLTLYVALSGSVSGSIISKVLLESLLIGGWVFTWEAIHITFLDIVAPFNRRRELKRFLNAEISFKHL